jgi:hypothetical protein
MEKTSSCHLLQWFAFSRDAELHPVCRAYSRKNQQREYAVRFAPLRVIPNCKIPVEGVRVGGFSGSADWTHATEIRTVR